jgi:hypothetical protein
MEFNEKEGYYYLPVYEVGEAGLVEVNEPNTIGTVRFVTGVPKVPTQSEVDEAKAVLGLVDVTEEAKQQAMMTLRMAAVANWSGVLHSDLLQCLIADLTKRGPHNKGVGLALMNLEQAAMWMDYKG